MTRRPVQAAHAVDQPASAGLRGAGATGGHRRDLLAGRPEELGEAALRLQVAAHHHGVVRLERLGHAVDQRPGEAQRVAHLADRRAGAVGDDVADHARVGLAVALVDVLDDLLAARRGEVDVHVGVGGAALVDEALEEQVVADGVDPRDAQHVGHDRVARAAPPLGRDALLAGEPHEVPADEEELGQAGPVDDPQLVVQLGLDGRRDGPVATGQARLAEARQLLQRRRAVGHLEAGEAVALEAQVHLAARRQLMGQLDARPPGPPDRVARTLLARRQGGHLGRPAQGVDRPVTPQVGARLQRQAVPDGHQHVLQLVVLRARVVHVVGDDEGQAGRGRQVHGQGHQQVVVGPQVVLGLQEEPAAPAEAGHGRVERRVPPGHLEGARPIARQQPPRDLRVAAPGERHQPLRVAGQQRLVEAGHALRAGQVRRARQAAQAAIAGRVAGQQHQVRPPLAVADAAQVLPAGRPVPRHAQAGRARRDRLAGLGGRRVRGRGPAGRSAAGRDDEPRRVGHGRVKELHLQADDRPQAGLLRRGDEADRPVEALVVGQGEGAQVQLARPGHQVVRGRGAVEEREAGMAVQFRVGQYQAPWQGPQDRTSVRYMAARRRRRGRVSSGHATHGAGCARRGHPDGAPDRPRAAAGRRGVGRPPFLTR